MRLLPPFLFLMGTALLAQEIQRPTVVLVITPPSAGSQVVPIDTSTLHGDLSLLFEENGLKELPGPAAGASTLTIYPETFRLRQGVCAFSAVAYLEQPGRSQALRGRILAAVRGESTVFQGLRQAVVDVAAALLGKNHLGGGSIKGIQVQGLSVPPSRDEIPIDHLKVRVRPLDPAYPPLARNRGLQGTVEVRLMLDDAGIPDRADLVSGPPELGLAALQHAMLWRFAPPMGPSGPVPVKTVLKVPFSLSRGLLDLSLPTDDPPPRSHRPEHIGDW